MGNKLCGDSKIIINPVTIRNDHDNYVFTTQHTSCFYVSLELQKVATFSNFVSYLLGVKIRNSSLITVTNIYTNKVKEYQFYDLYIEELFFDGDRIYYIYYSYDDYSKHLGSIGSETTSWNNGIKYGDKMWSSNVSNIFSSRIKQDGVEIYHDDDFIMMIHHKNVSKISYLGDYICSCSKNKAILTKITSNRTKSSRNTSIKN
jgi:hypothetical protein